LAAKREETERRAVLEHLVGSLALYIGNYPTIIVIQLGKTPSCCVMLKYDIDNHY
jgi:hypothetical protein